MIAAILASPTRTNWELVQAWRGVGIDARSLWPLEALEVLGPGDVAITRVDVLPSLDGVEPGLDEVRELEARGVRVLNRPDALLGTHDKLLTAHRLDAAGLPHPLTLHLEPGAELPELPFPCVLKPRFGSWGHDVFRCASREELEATLEEIRGRPWWRKHGALVQELVQGVREDLRLVVAGGRVVGAARRIAAEGEWRTNISVGGSLAAATVSPDARELGVRAAQAVGVDFTGVDLLPSRGAWVVLELNGAVDFDRRYALPGQPDPYAAIVDALGLAARAILQDDVRKERAMPKSMQGKPARAGDEIVITGHSVGDSPRTAVILEVLGEPGRERYRVRWEDDHESIYFPADDAIIRHPPAKSKARSRTKA
jgi:RimK family alpha-L-glutamate ligase